MLSQWRPRHPLPSDRPQQVCNRSFHQQNQARAKERKVPYHPPSWILLELSANPGGPIPVAMRRSRPARLHRPPQPPSATATCVAPVPATVGFLRPLPARPAAQPRCRPLGQRNARRIGEVGRWGVTWRAEPPLSTDRVGLQAVMPPGMQHGPLCGFNHCPPNTVQPSARADPTLVEVWRFNEPCTFLRKLEPIGPFVFIDRTLRYKKIIRIIPETWKLF